MISVVVATLNSETDLPHTLAPLVAAAVDGLVREVVTADGGSTDLTLAIADDAGARIVKGALSEGVAAAKSEWLLILEPGMRLAEGWERLVSTHMAKQPNRAGTFRLGWLRKGGLLVRRELYGKAGRPVVIGPADSR